MTNAKSCGRIVATLLATLSVSALCGSAFAQGSAWTVTQNGSEVVATDCGNCGEETQIVMSCTAGGKLAQVIVNGAASAKGSAGAIAPVVFYVSGEKFTYSAKTLSFDNQGYMPVFIMIPDDPMIDWLKSGKNASVSFNGTRTTFDLNGSERALNQFQKLCGWNQPTVKNNPLFTSSLGEYASDHVPDYSQTVGIITPALPDEEGRFWHTGDGFGGGSARTLSYSLTDSLGELVSASCEKFGNDKITLNTNFELNERQDGEGVILEILHDNGVSSYTGKVNAVGESGPSAHFTVPANDPMWNSLAFSPSVVMRLRGGQPLTINGMTGNAAIQEFSRTCSTRIEATENTQNNFISPNFTVGLK